MKRGKGERRMKDGTGVSAVDQNRGRNRTAVCPCVCLNVCMDFTHNCALVQVRCSDIFKKKREKTEHKTSKILQSLPGMGFSSPPTCR